MATLWPRMDDTPATCTRCGHVYAKDEKPPCPECGDTRRTFDKVIATTVAALASVSGLGRRPGFPRAFVRFVERTKVSRLGKLARESLRFDRSDRKKTVKTHHVEEQQPDGSWNVVHDEREEYPAKRRPQAK